MSESLDQRNSFFLAEHGFDVDAVDVSDVAIQGVTRGRDAARAERARRARGRRGDAVPERAELRVAFPALETLAYREDPEAWRAGIVARRPGTGAADSRGVDSAAS